MSQEQWEIDLRKQLEEVAAKHEETWEDRLREEISNLPPRQKPQSNLFYFLAVIIALVVVLGFFYDQKTGVISKVISNNPSAQPEPYPRDNSTAQIRALQVDIDKVKAENKERWEALAKKVGWNADRIMLIGALHNENLLVLASKAESSQFIYFNKDWTISSLPQYLELTDEDRDFLGKYLKKN